jgi:hypothetical protein
MIATVLAFAAIGLWSQVGSAYDQYSQNGGDATNCGACHGDFRAIAYTSPRDGMNWGNLHNLHRTTMLASDCDACHGANTFPVILDSSSGGTGLDPIGCAGCHGRAEDNVAGNPEVDAGRTGYGAGLRQHHFTTGTAICANCHLDANPASYTPVGENALPPYYANPGTGHPAMPDDACNANTSEDFAGASEGLDNDGDDVYDTGDSNCMTPVESATWGALKSIFRY